MKSNITKKINSFKELKFIPLNTVIPLDKILSNFPTLILNFSSPNVTLLFNYLQHFLSQQINNKESIQKIKIVCIIPHKIKNYEEYLVNNLSLPIYQLTDVFELNLLPNQELILTNINNTLEIKKSNFYYELAYLYLEEDKIDFCLQNNVIDKNNHEMFQPFTFYLLNQPFPINYSTIIKDIQIKSFRKSYLILTLYNFMNKSKVELNFINLSKKLEIENIFQFEYNFFIKSIDLLPLDHNNILLFYLDYENIFFIYKYNIDQNKVVIQKKIDLKSVNSRFEGLDLKKLRANYKNIAVWDHNTLHIFEYKINDKNDKLELEIFFSNTSGQKTKHLPKPIDGIWKQTIWGNINNVYFEDNYLFVADSEYPFIRKLNIETGKSESLFFRESEKKYENLKGRISSVFPTNNSIFFIDIDFKRIRKVDYTLLAKSLFFDENINLYSQVFFLNDLNAIIYNSNKNLIFLNLYTLKPHIFDLYL